MVPWWLYELQHVAFLPGSGYFRCMKLLKYLLGFLLFLLLVITVLLIWPKGSWQEQLQRNNVPALAYGIIENGQLQVSSRINFGLGWEVVHGLPDDEYALVHGGSDMGVRARAVVMPKSGRGFIAFTNGDQGQQLIDRIMVEEFEPEKALIRRMYAPILWRIIQLPFNPFYSPPR